MVMSWDLYIVLVEITKLYGCFDNFEKFGRHFGKFPTVSFVSIFSHTIVLVLARFISVCGLDIMTKLNRSRSLREIAVRLLPRYNLMSWFVYRFSHDVLYTAPAIICFIVSFSYVLIVSFSYVFMLCVRLIRGYQLAEWIANGGNVSSATAAAVTEECERMARIGDRPGRPGYDKKKMLLHAIVSGSRLQGDRLLRDIPVLFSTIEDFLWFKLAMVRDVTRQSPSEAMAQQSMALYTLEDLQNYLVKFEPSYYTKNGKDPLVYPYVLLLSLQLHGAIAYIMKEGNGGEGYPVDAVHIAVALADYGVLSEGLDGAQKLGSMDAVSEVASIIRQYGLSYVRQGNLRLGLEYYVQAAATIGGGAISWSGSSSSGQQRQRLLMLKQLLTELLLRDGGIALLLGSTGTHSGGALKRFLPDSQAQHHLLLDAARQCQESGLYDRVFPSHVLFPNAMWRGSIDLRYKMLNARSSATHGLRCQCYAYLGFLLCFG